MTDSLSSERKLTRTLQIAIVDCSDWPRGQYIWKQASMKKLAGMGLTEKVGWLYGDAYALTDAGKLVLEKIKCKSK